MVQKPTKKHNATSNMADQFFHCINILFKIAVLGFLFLEIVEVLDRFIKNDDVSLISFKTFHEEQDNLYPTMTMCFYNPFIQGELEKYGPGINTTSYSQYLQGNVWTDQMQNVLYDNVTISMEDFLQGISGKLENGSYVWLYHSENRYPLYQLDNKPPYFVSYKNGLSKCFSFDIPYIADTVFWSLFVQIKSPGSSLLLRRTCPYDYKTSVYWEQV